MMRCTYKTASNALFIGNLLHRGQTAVKGAEPVTPRVGPICPLRGDLQRLVLD